MICLPLCIKSNKQIKYWIKDLDEPANKDIKVGVWNGLNLI